MKKFVTAVALTIALPGAALAQAAPSAQMQGMNMSGMNMSGMNMSGMDMQKMTCSDMRAMMAKGQSMHMSTADMAKMCPGLSKAAPKSGAPGTRQGHSH